MIDDDRVQQRMQRIADLIGRLEKAGDPGVRAQSKELLESVMSVHGEAFERVIERLRSLGEAGTAILDSLVADPVVASVLLLYGLHPVDLESRARRALEKAATAIRSYGARAELVSAAEGVLRIQVRGVENAFSARAVKSAIEEEIYAAAPDAVSLVLSGLEKFASPDFVPLERVGAL